MGKIFEWLRHSKIYSRRNTFKQNLRKQKEEANHAISFTCNLSTVRWSPTGKLKHACVCVCVCCKTGAIHPALALWLSSILSLNDGHLPQPHTKMRSSLACPPFHDVCPPPPLDPATSYTSFAGGRYWGKIGQTCGCVSVCSSPSKGTCSSPQDEKQWTERGRAPSQVTLPERERERYMNMRQGAVFWGVAHHACRSRFCVARQRLLRPAPINPNI